MRLPVPLRGPASIPFRAFGIRPSRMNPNTCTLCELMFTRVMKARKITVDVSVLFADLRDYTTLSQSLSADSLQSLLDDLLCFSRVVVPTARCFSSDSYAGSVISRSTDSSG